MTEEDFKNTIDNELLPSIKDAVARWPGGVASILERGNKLISIRIAWAQEIIVFTAWLDHKGNPNFARVA